MFVQLLYVAVGSMVLFGFYHKASRSVNSRRAYKGSARLPMYYAANKKGGDRFVV